jgi:urea transport system substrate-binding protein
MGVVAVSAEEFAAVPAEAVFDRFGAGSGAGWLFDAACDRLAVGSVVTIRVPFGRGQPVDILGRVSGLRRPTSITIDHDQPWRGRIRLRFAPTPGGTRIRLSAEVDERGLEWLMRRQGLPVGGPAPSEGHRIGLLTSKSGSASLFAAATENVATLALEEINADGGVLRCPVELLIADDGTDPALGVIEANRLVRAGCRTVFVTTTSATWDAVSASLRGSGVLLVQPQMNEGGVEDRLRVRLGERPATQLAAAAPPLIRAGGRRWFLAGNDYVWPRRLNSAARAILPHFGATLVGECYAPLGVDDHTAIVEAVLDSGADVVLSSFVGADSAAFERQCHAAGVRERAVTLAPAMDESTLERIGVAAAPGIRGISGYFQRLETEGNDSLLRRYRATFGRWAPPLSTLSEAVFEALHVWAAAVRRAGTADPGSVADEMRVGRFELPRGTVTLDGTDQVKQRLYLAEVRGETFDSMLPVGAAG